MTERPNIRRMQMPERPEYRIQFDADKELTADDWKTFMHSWSMLTQNTRTAHFDVSTLGQSLLILKPTIDLEFTEELRKELIKGLHDRLNIKDTDRVYAAAAHTYNFLRMLGYPEPRSRSFAEHFEEHMRTMQTKMEPADQQIAEVVISAFAENPGNVSQRDKDWLQWSFEQLAEGKSNTEISNAIAAAAALRCMGEHVAISQEIWQRFTSAIQEDRRMGDMHQLVDDAARLKILAADSVTMTEKGPQLEFSRKLRKERSSIMPSTLDI